MSETQEKQHWIPLEANPDVLNKYIHSLGVSQIWNFVDVYGLDPELLTLIPRPVAAVMLLYPITEKTESKAIGEVKSEKGLYFVKQTISNACGTIAIVHALANTKDAGIEFDDEKYFSKFLKNTSDMSPDERAKYLEKDKNMGLVHDEIAQEGQTEAPPREEKVKTHFVAFVNHKGGIYELNGASAGPIYHGPSESNDLLMDVVPVVKDFMTRDPEELSFSLMALSKNDD